MNNGEEKRGKRGGKVEWKREKKKGEGKSSFKRVRGFKKRRVVEVRKNVQKKDYNRRNLNAWVLG